MSRKQEHPEELPADFTPGPNDVVVGRGRKIHDLEGNKRMRDIVKSELTAYYEADKTEKSYILMRVLRCIRERSAHAFVKQDPKSGRWLNLTDTLARATLAQAFRDALSPKYRSSKFSKQRKRLYKKEATVLQQGEQVIGLDTPSPLCMPFKMAERSSSNWKNDDLRSLMALAYRRDHASQQAAAPRMRSQAILGSIGAAVSHCTKERRTFSTSADVFEEVDQIYSQQQDDAQFSQSCTYSQTMYGEAWVPQPQFPCYHSHEGALFMDPLEALTIGEAYGIEEEDILDIMPVWDI